MLDLWGGGEAYGKGNEHCSQQCTVGFVQLRRSQPETHRCQCATKAERIDCCRRIPYTIENLLQELPRLCCICMQKQVFMSLLGTDDMFWTKFVGRMSCFLGDLTSSGEDPTCYQERIVKCHVDDGGSLLARAAQRCSGY